MSAVQTGVWYAPAIRFALFDIAIDDDFLAHAEVETLATAHGLFVVPLLARGPRADLEALPVRFPSRVPTLLGLPAIADNIAEGFVLKPDAHASVHDRQVTKWKIPELDDARFDESLPFDADATLDAAALSTVAARMVDMARIAPARSKVGSNADAICEEIVLDVLVDLEAAFPRAFRMLDERGEEALRGQVACLARTIV